LIRKKFNAGVAEAHAHGEAKPRLYKKIK